MRVSSHPTYGAGEERVDEAGATGWLFRLGPDPDAWPEPTCSLADGQGERADPETLNQVYGKLLKHLRLSDRHARDLRRRGLTDEQIRAGGYATIDRGRVRAVQEVVRAGLERHLPTVPGFFVQEKDGRRWWSLTGRGGLAVPVRDPQGLIVALLVRADGSGKGGKYTYLSTKKRGGAGPGAPVHFPLFTGDRARVRVTEGGLKADVATARSGLLTIGLSGVAVWRRAAEALQELQAKTAVLALDADARHNVAVARALVGLAEDLQANHFAVELEVWDEADGKGIDDLLAAGRAPRLLTGAAVLPAAREVLGAAVAACPDHDQAAQAPPAGQDGHAAAVGQPWAEPAHLTDTGNATRFTRDHGSDVRHCHPWHKWLGWDGRRWLVDDTGSTVRRAKATVKGLYEWAAARLQELKDGAAGGGAARVAAVEAVLKWALLSESAPRLAAMLDLARSELPVLPGAMDRDPFLLNAANGTLDLRTGRLRPHRRDDLLTKLCPTEFNPDADCPVFLRTLDGIFAGDRELTRYVQRFMGYALTGDVREDSLAIAYGGGGNGKTLFFSALLDTIGPDYSGTVPPELLMETRNEQHPTIKADLFGKRLMVAAETGEGRRLNESRIKALTGRDPVKARRMREDFWWFDPTHKLVLFTNHKPEIRGTDHGIWRRLALWPFGVTFWDPDKGETGKPELRADKGLPDKLKAERPGILAWLVAGCLEWQRDGLRMPEKVRAATAEYRAAQDVLAAFVADCCLTGPNYSCPATPLYNAYRAWAKDAHEDEISQRRFGDTMSERGYERYTSNGTRYKGLALRNL
jgi:putative DNA primase/helicase